MICLSRWGAMMPDAGDAILRPDAAGPRESDRASLAAALRGHRLILFDLDDTLCDFTTARVARLERAFADALARDGIPLPDDDLARLVARSIAIHPYGTDHFPELLGGIGASDAAIAGAVRWFREHRFHRLALFDAARMLLAALRRQPGVPGRRLGIITNGPAEVQRAKVELLAVADLVDFIVISGEFGVDKPDPAIFREALRLGAAAAADALYIGDSPEYDIAGARAAGLTPVWVNRAGADWPGPGARPDLVIRGIDRLADALGAD